MNTIDEEGITTIELAVFITAAAVVLYILIRKIIMSMIDHIEPVKGTITSPFGSRTAPVAGASTYHGGVDIGVKTGTIVRAPWDGTVKNAYYDNQYGGGNTLLITHDNGYTTGYCHLSEFLVSKGDTVKMGQKICKSGNTGRATGPHLHFSLRDKTNTRIDPCTIFSFK